MGGNGYIKFILTLIALTVALSAYLLIGQAERQRLMILRLENRLTNLENRPSGAGVSVSLSGNAAVVANSEFYDPAAQFGGRMITSVSADTPGLNPLTGNDAVGAGFQALCNASLGESNFEHPEEIRPLLAESWEISPDHLTYRIKLRRGVYWHDFTDPVTGKQYSRVPVTAYDFAFFVEAVKNPDVNCEPLRIYYSGLKDIEVVNDYEFIVHWSTPYYNSYSATLSMAPLPRHFYCPDGAVLDGKKFNDDHLRNRMIVGCGPYCFVRWEKDGQILFRRNHDYFGIASGAAPALEQLAVQVIKMPNTRMLALLGGKLDRLDLTPEQWMHYVEGGKLKTNEFRSCRYLDQAYNYLGWNERNVLFRDRRVRKALTMLIDREKIRRDIYCGLAEIATGPFFPLSRYHDPAIKPLPFDPEAAKLLLADAGWRDTDGDGILDREGVPFSFTMLQVSGHPIQSRMLPLIKEFLAAGGIDMKIQTVEWSVYLQRLENFNFDASCLGWTSPFDPDPYQVWHSSGADVPGSSNYIGFRNSEADRLIEELRCTFDMEKRVELAHRFCRLIHDEQPYTFLFVPYRLDCFSSCYRNVREFPGGIPGSLFWMPAGVQRTVPGF